MNAKRYSVVIVVVLLALLMSSCGYHHGIKSCGYGGFLGFGRTWVNQGQLHPENSNFVCDGTNFVPVTNETALTPPANTEPQTESEAEIPATIACETIMVSKDNGITWVSAGLALETESKYDIGNRVTWTSRSSLVDKAYNEALSTDELKTVEQTWLDVRFNACNTEAVVFASGFEMGNVKFDGGVLFSFKGEKQLRVRNGEIVLWYDTAHRDKDLGRVIDQIKVGNFDIHGPLALAVADGLKDVKVVADYLATHPDVKIVILP